MRYLGSLLPFACVSAIFFFATSPALSSTPQPVKQAVEFLVFEMAPEHRDAFISLDDQIWTPSLSKQNGFVSKEVWIDENRPNQVTLVTYWSSYALWKAIPHSELKATDEKFKRAFGHPFKLIKELHKTHRWFRIKNTTKTQTTP